MGEEVDAGMLLLSTFFYYFFLSYDFFFGEAEAVFVNASLDGGKMGWN
jgi:hypothetical protein